MVSHLCVCWSPPLCLQTGPVVCSRTKYESLPPPSSGSPWPSLPIKGYSPWVCFWSKVLESWKTFTWRRPGSNINSWGRSCRMKKGKEARLTSTTAKVEGGEVWLVTHLVLVCKQCTTVNLVVKKKSLIAPLRASLWVATLKHWDQCPVFHTAVRFKV